MISQYVEKKTEGSKKVVKTKAPREASRVEERFRKSTFFFIVFSLFFFSLKLITDGGDRRVIRSRTMSSGTTTLEDSPGPLSFFYPRGIVQLTPPLFTQTYAATDRALSRNCCFLISTKNFFMSTHDWAKETMTLSSLVIRLYVYLSSVDNSLFTFCFCSLKNH